MEPSEATKPRFRAALKVVRAHRRAVLFAVYGGVTVASYFFAFLLRFELTWPAENTPVFWRTLPLLLVLRLVMVSTFRLHSSRLRFVGTQDLLRLFVAVTLGSAFFFVLTWDMGFPAPVPRSVILLEWVFTGYGIAGVWIAYRVIFQRLRRAEALYAAPEKRVLVVGAGEAGAMLVREMTRSPTGHRPVGFLDDDREKKGLSIHGVEVLGGTDELPVAAEKTGAEEIIIAVPSAQPGQLSQIVERCEATGVAFKLLPGIREVLAGEAHLHQLRPVQIEDLLGRQPINLELPRLTEELEEKCVLVTGAAGSIGSELCRQIALHSPRKLVLFDQAETPLVDLDLELRDRLPEVELVPVVGDVTDAARVEQVFEEHQPGQVFHAAAYKHVPMMELNPTEAVRNNVIGTWIVARTAGQNGAGKFVLVSTDKAVRPVNVMGATKRLAELVVLESQERFPETSFAAVRFGNVLGSNGSVIPLFRRQIKQGRPLTVTHPEITRYFMTIPEAVQLILQASLLPDLKGQIAMLDMGEPVKILDLARTLLRLSGLPSVIDRDIIFTGLRPGEKLHEELVAPDEETVETEVEKVRLVVLSGHHVWVGQQAIGVCAAALGPFAREVLSGELSTLLRQLGPEAGWEVVEGRSRLFG